MRIFGNIQWDENELFFGGMLDGSDCRTGFWKATYTAKLRKRYGGKKTGTQVTWKHYHTINVRKLANDPDAGFMIQSAKVTMDWSAFYK